ncbi:MAG: hypothetical protein HZB68_05075 [Candidatus Aenigmarchaeota archaeon]|nr:hypothetical protein [Candidatus Aenigmarchaeota archaeon]
MSWECPFCGGVPMWKNGPKSYCAKCNKVFNNETGTKEMHMEEEDAGTCKDVKLS